MKRPPPPLLALAALLAQHAVTRGAHRPTATHAVVAAAMAGASAGVAGAAAREFRRRDTTVEPFDPSQATVLVTDGVNTITRNPMYLGLTGLLVANAVRRGSWTALLPVAGFMAFIDRVQIAAEESALRAKFGADYEAYLASAPRWLGLRSFGRGVGPDA